MTAPSILYFQQNAAFGATEAYLYDLASQMKKRGYCIELVFPDTPQTQGFWKLKDEGVRLYGMPSWMYTAPIPRLIPAWYRFFQDRNVALIHFNDPCLIGSIAAMIAGIPWRLMTHHTPQLKRQYNSIGRLMERAAFFSYTKCIVTSEQDRLISLERDHLPDSKIKVIPYGLRPLWFSSIDQNYRGQIRKSLGLSDIDIMVLVPARLSPQKRHDILLKVAKDILSHHENVWFFLAGDGEIRSEIEHLILEYDIGHRVKLLGHRADIVDLMTASDIVSLASDFEGLVYAFVEAGARQVPIVATNVGGVSYSVVDGETGILVQPGEAEALAKALLKLIQDRELRERMGRAGRARSERLFTLDRMITETESLYKELLGSESANINAQ